MTDEPTFDEIVAHVQDQLDNRRRMRSPRDRAVDRHNDAIVALAKRMSRAETVTPNPDLL